MSIIDYVKQREGQLTDTTAILGNTDAILDTSAILGNTDTVLGATLEPIRGIVIHGEIRAQNAYLEMLYNSTGNIYKLDKNNRLVFGGSDSNFRGVRSETLISVIQRGIDSENLYTLYLVGARRDDHNVFIDSYEKRQIDVSDLRLIGRTSTALQGALVGHFLNEVQVPGGFQVAHAASLLVEGRIFGELVGDPTIVTREDRPEGAAIDGFQTVIFEYNSTNRFAFQQGATSIRRGTGQFINPRVEIMETVTVSTGQLKSVRKIR